MWLKRSHVCIESAEACSVKSEDFAVTFLIEPRAQR